MNILVQPEAEQDISVAADFYESQSPGLGNYFIASIISDIESLRIYAGVHETIHGFQRSKSKRFPFAI